MFAFFVNDDGLDQPEVINSSTQIRPDYVGKPRMLWSAILCFSHEDDACSMSVEFAAS